jgi:tetrahydromethanopterin S-methyltransferase subunit G
MSQMPSPEYQKRIKADRDFKEQQKLLESTSMAYDTSQQKQFKEIRKVRDISFLTGLGIGALITVIIYKIRS